MFRNPRRSNRKAHKIADFQQMVTCLQKKTYSLKDAIFRSSTLTNVTKLPSYSISQSLISTCRCLDSIATEVQKRTAVDKNAIMFNVSDFLLLEVKSCITKASGTAHHKGTCIRLRKTSQCNVGPLSFQFSDEPMAK